MVLDLHCDGEAEVHLYTQAASLDRLMPLAALTGCRAVLLADVSGGNPFDEAVSRPWLDLAARLPRPSRAPCLRLRHGRVARAVGRVARSLARGMPRRLWTI